MTAQTRHNHTAAELVELYREAATACNKRARLYTTGSEDHQNWLEARDGFLSLARLFEEDVAMEQHLERQQQQETQAR
jgi:hypothetical protein